MDHDRYPEIAGLVDKPSGLAPLPLNVEAAALGRPLPGPYIEVPPKTPSLHDYFSRGRGRTAGILAAAVASGRAATYHDLAALAQVAPDTANKLVGYLAPLLRAREDVPADSSITQAVVYRWCGEHARYLMSWARRRLPDDVQITRWAPPRASH